MKRLTVFPRLSLALTMLCMIAGFSPAPAIGQVATAFPGTTTVGGGTQVLSVTVTLKTGGEIAGARVMTQGKVNGDFTAAGGDTCTGQTLGANQSCTFPVQFKPAAPGERRGAVLLLDANGGLLGTQMLYGIGSGSLGIMIPGTIQTLAGVSGTWFYKNDGVPANYAPIYFPEGVAADASGNVFLSDTNNSRIRRIDAQTGLISTVAGTGSAGTSGDNGPATSAALNTPAAMIIDGAGDIIFADSQNHAIRKVSLATGTLSTIAGRLGTAGFAGDGGAASSALLNGPESIAMNARGDLFIADSSNCRIRKVDAQTGLISTVVGNGNPGSNGDGGQGTAAQVAQPFGLATDPAGDLFIADLAGNVVRELSASGIMSTVAGTGSAGDATEGTPGTSTPLRQPSDVKVDVAGDLYIADSGNNLIRKLSAVTGLMTSVGGNGSTFQGGDGGAAVAAGIDRPYALALDSQGNVLLADTYDNRVREIQNSIVYLKYNPIKVGGTSPQQGVTVENDGNVDMHFTAIVPDGNSALDTSKTTCLTTIPLTTGATCLVGAEFVPLTVGSTVTAAIQVQTDAANTPDVINLTGESDTLEPTVTTLTADVNPVGLGAQVTFTAVVSGNGVAPAGNVKFYDGTNLLGTVATGATGSTATFPISTLALGPHTITAAFGGDSTNSPSTSAVLTEIVKQASTVTLSSNLMPSKVGQSITFSATVTGASTTPGGSVVFNDNGSQIGTGAVNGSGVASTSTNLLAAGTHTITAVYSGDTNTLPGTSAALSQAVNLWSTSTTLTSSNPTDSLGSPLIFSVHVTTTSTVPPSGAVVLTDNGVSLAMLVVDGSGNASYSNSSLAVGTHALVATYQADSTNDTSSSAPLTQTVQTISTSTGLTSSANPVSAGATLHLVATVAAVTNVTAGAPTGVVTFKDGTTAIGTATISPTGVATLDVASLGVGTHGLAAVYGGSTNYASSTSNTLSEVVQLATTSVQLASSSNPSISGKGVTLTAVVSGSGGVPGGTVTFLNGGVTLGTGTVGGSGQATLGITTLPVGSLSLVATYGGDAKDNPSTSPALTQVVQQATTQISLTSSANPSFAGGTVTYLASLSSNGGVPSGQIVLTEGGSVLSTATMNGTGVASFSLNSLVAGSHTLIASFAGDASHSASTSNALVQVVQTGTSVTSIVSSKNPSVFGDQIGITFKVTGTAQQPTGTVTLMDQGTTLTTVTLNASGVATYPISNLTIGDHPLTATYSGDTTHAGSTSTVLTQRVQESTTTTILSSENPSLVGDAVKLTAAVVGTNGAAVTGTVTFTDGTAVLGSGTVANGSVSISISSLVEGTHLIVASYSGDATNVASASAMLSQVVMAAGTTVTLSSNVNPSVTGSAVIFSAAVSSKGENATGSVTFMDGSTTLGTGKVTNGVATFSTSGLTAGQHAIVARYGGDAGTQVSVSNALLQAIQNKTGISVVSSLNPALTLQGIVLTATVTNGENATGVVTFTDGATQIGSVNLASNGTAVLSLPSLAAGSHALVASYGGDSYNLPSTTAALTQTVQLRATTTSMAVSSDTYLSGAQITLVDVVRGDGPAAPTGTVTFMSGTNLIGTAQISTGGIATLTFFPVDPSYTIVATYSGDAAYAGSVADAVTITEGPSTTFTMTANPSTMSMASGSHTTISLTMTSVKNFADTISLGCLGLPADATCTFSTDKAALAANGTNVVQLTIDTGNPLGVGTSVTAKAKRMSLFDGVPGTLEAGLAIPAALLLGGLLGWGRRRRTLPRLLSLIVLIGMGMGLTSCANQLTQNKTPAGSYTVRIVASGVQTGASEISDLALTVTQ
ncbi:Ig-like domain repeat protein [Granulicella sibirica]|nr:Ig-like domain repeat protein [Granulicella sibirica]